VPSGNGLKRGRGITQAAWTVLTHTALLMSRLSAAFAADWSVDDQRMFGTAYQKFRAALVVSSPSPTNHQS
jgi:hypothetical protein